MPSKRTSNDVDLVEPTQYNVESNRIAKETPKPWPLPNFNASHINDFNNHGKLNLRPGVEQSNLFAIFS
jgi:hypothetical protein